MNAFRPCVAALFSFAVMTSISVYAQNPPQATEKTPKESASPATSAPVSILSPSTTSSGALPPPVQSTTLSDVNPESIGILSPDKGGFGAGLWDHTKRETLNRLLPALTLPTTSPTLNDVARRLLLTTAHVPTGVANAPSLTNTRIEKLTALGDGVDAWKLAMLAKPDTLDEKTLRDTAEVALLSDQGTEMCNALPNLIKKYQAPEWQKLQLICQLHNKDTKSAQVTLDLLRAQNVNDDLFYILADRAIAGNTKQLPRQLTPLKPLDLVLLRLMDAPVPPELYAHPNAALIPALLQAKAVEDSSKLQLAERAAATGIITDAELAAAYQSVDFTPEALAAPLTTGQQGVKLRALLYQAAAKETDVAKKAEHVKAFAESLNPSDISASMARVLVGLLGQMTPSDTYDAASGLFLRLYVLGGGNLETTRAWIKQAHHAAVGMPNVAADLHDLWPIIVLSGVESPVDYAKNVDGWLTDALGKDDDKSAQSKAASVLLILDAMGYVVSDEQWAKVADVSAPQKRLMPSPFLLERLRETGVEGRRGETLLLALLAAQGGDDPALLTSLETIRALRLAGLGADAGVLAREVVFNLKN